MADNAPSFRLRKTQDSNRIIGPMPLEELKRLAQTAFIAPDDMVDENDDQWKPPFEIEELEMVWNILVDGEVAYGPTSPGTITDFLVSDEITREHRVAHHKSGKELSVRELLGDKVVAPDLEHVDDSKPEDQEEEGDIAPDDPTSVIQAPALDDKQKEEEDDIVTFKIDDPTSDTVKSSEDEKKDQATHYEKGIDMAKDLRIRQLEADLEALHNEHERVLQEYRRLTQQMIQLKKNHGIA